MSHHVSIMCDDIHATVADLRGRGLEIPDEPQDQGFGIATMIVLPGGLRMQVYEPRHKTAI